MVILLSRSAGSSSDFQLLCCGSYSKLSGNWRAIVKRIQINRLGLDLSDQAESQRLHQVGLKATAARIRILQLLERSHDRHLSADEVHHQLQQDAVEIGLATVYRVLSQFESAGLVTRHNFEEGRSVFERTTDDHHDHMVCLDTGKVIEFVDDSIEQIQRAIADEHGYEIINHNMVLFVRPKKNDDSS